MKVYCTKDATHKSWSDDKFCTTCGGRLLRDSTRCKTCNRQQFPPLGSEDKDIKFCAFCGSKELETITEENG